MIARKQAIGKRGETGGFPPEVKQARKHLRITGWTYRAAAEELGVHFTHLALVLTGRRESRRLLTGIMALPERE